nr:hypothetical protein EC90111_0512 [Escherichia coli 9.0111]
MRLHLTGNRGRCGGILRNFRNFPFLVPAGLILAIRDN